MPFGGPDQRITKPSPLGPIGDFVVALARAGDGRIATRPTYAGGGPPGTTTAPTAQDRLGGERAPDHAVADVDRGTAASSN